MIHDGYEPQLGPPYNGGGIGCGSLIVGVIVVIALFKACGLV